MTDTDRATERLAVMLFEAGIGNLNRAESKFMAEVLTAQGYGHQENILRAFAEWCEANWANSSRKCLTSPLVAHYLTSLAEKGEKR